MSKELAPVFSIDDIAKIKDFGKQKRVVGVGTFLKCFVQ